MNKMDPAAGLRILGRHKLAAATRSINWTYSIFWNLNPDERLLVWGEGYYNGSVKSNKVLHALDSSKDDFGMHRSQQLRELFLAMNAGRDLQRLLENPLNPGELTEAEWFYISCMSYSFPSGGGLPGRALVKRRYVWHCAMGEANNRAFIRAPLAQTAHIQTVVCIPMSSGVLEFGTTELVEEDLQLLQQIQILFLDESKQPITGIEFSAIHMKGRTIQTLSETASAEDVNRSEVKARVGGNVSHRSVFREWGSQKLIPRQYLLENRQRMLKIILMTIPRLHGVDTSRGPVYRQMEVDQNRVAPKIGDSSGGAHVLAERRRRVKLNDQFVTLRKLVPFVTKTDKVSLLGDAIDYVKELQRRVKDIEDAANRSEQLSKQEVDILEESVPDGSRLKADKSSVEVTLESNMAIFKISCPWRGGLLIEILKKSLDLQLEVVGATATILDDTLTTTLTAKGWGSNLGSKQKLTEIQAAILQIIEGRIQGNDDASTKSLRGTFD